MPNYYQLVAHSTFLSSFCADIIAARAQTSGDQEKHFHHKPPAQSSMDHVILNSQTNLAAIQNKIFLQLLAATACELRV